MVSTFMANLLVSSLVCRLGGLVARRSAIPVEAR
jgi:hypothetical protein